MTIRRMAVTSLAGLALTTGFAISAAPAHQTGVTTATEQPRECGISYQDPECGQPHGPWGWD